MGCPGAKTIVLNRVAEAEGARLSVSNAGTGAVGDVFSSVPTWAWVAGGALIAGLVAGAVYFKKRKG